MASRKLVALFSAFAVVAATTVQPSEARIGGDQLLHPSTFHNTPPQSPSSSGGAVPPHLSSPPPPSPPAQPTECLTPLIGMMPCMNYLTNLTVLAPPAKCCDGLKSIIHDAPICLCHGMTGDMNDLMPVPIDPVRMIILPLACGAMLPLQTLFSCNTQQVPPIMPPMAVPAPANPPGSPIR
ncbi:hypothetical protein SEVIR_2G070432v4 [Setaria viridis]|uniref:Bifunctional inhibitor/plant lipid transfer protein/seed storage helical domain-containing protein n=1 Tax=Setaria viridis TaxID=4556 RepID=A0A4U6VQV3_SETVI|nr:non-specific lipid-transfer protein C6-like [Setaria viridis]TKW30923.1 hypothetical protein SEVIR_2G070432v2 [Setaria viridis]